MVRGMTELLSPAVRALLESDAVATVVTLDPDGTPHVSSAWVGLEDGEIVIGTLDDQRKLRNLRRDARIALAIQSSVVNSWGLREYLVVNGTARVTEGGQRRCSNAWRGRTSGQMRCSRPCRTRRRGM
jgi:PPOX class probable F420-dependent enzyme